MSEKPVVLAVCTRDDLHPFECGPGCRHCAGNLLVNDKGDVTHDPNNCALCNYDVAQ